MEIVEEIAVAGSQSANPRGDGASRRLEARVTALEARNRSVETNKRWETSWTRRGAIVVLTYLSIAAYLGLVVHINPWLNAVVPALAFALSTLTLGIIRRFWQKNG